MTEIESEALADLLSREDLMIHLFVKGGRQCQRLPVEIDTEEECFNVYHRRKLYMRVFYGLIHHLQYESIRFDMRIVRFRYRDQTVGLQMISR